jgi:hypothetical protein
MSCYVKNNINLYSFFLIAVFLFGLYILFTPLIETNGEVIFFKRNYVIWSLLCAMAIYSIALKWKTIFKRDVIIAYFLYFICFCCITIYHFINDKQTSYTIILMYFSYIFYYFTIYAVVYNYKKTLKEIIVLYSILIIVSQTLLAVLEWFLVTNGYWERSDVMNIAKEHYSVFSRINMDVFWYRPLGLFGQYSINASAPILAFVSYLYIKNGKINRFLLLLVSVNTFISGSATGYILYLFLILLLIIHVYRHKVLIFLLILLILPILLIFLSILGIDNYLIYFQAKIYGEMEVFQNKINIFLNISTIDMLFGLEHGEGNPGSPDGGGLYLLLTHGLIGLLLYFLIFIFTIFHYKNLYLKIFILLLFLGSMHYVLIGNQAVAFLTALVLVYYDLNNLSFNK